MCICIIYISLSLSLYICYICSRIHTHVHMINQSVSKPASQIASQTVTVLPIETFMHLFAPDALHDVCHSERHSLSLCNFDPRCVDLRSLRTAAYRLTRLVDNKTCRIPKTASKQHAMVHDNSTHAALTCGFRA